MLPVCLSGVHSVQVLYDDTPVPKSPFRVSVSEGCDPSRVVATGPGLQQGLTEQPNNFSIFTRYWILVCPLEPLPAPGLFM